MRTLVTLLLCLCLGSAAFAGSETESGATEPRITLTVQDLPLPDVATALTYASNVQVGVVDKCQARVTWSAADQELEKAVNALAAAYGGSWMRGYLLEPNPPTTNYTADQLAGMIQDLRDDWMDSLTDQQRQQLFERWRAAGFGFGGRGGGPGGPGAPNTQGGGVGAQAQPGGALARRRGGFGQQPGGPPQGGIFGQPGGAPAPGMPGQTAGTAQMVPPGMPTAQAPGAATVPPGMPTTQVQPGGPPQWGQQAPGGPPQAAGPGGQGGPGGQWGQRLYDPLAQLLMPVRTETVTLHLHNVSVKQALFAILEASGFPVVAGNNVTGTVTINVDNAPLQDALDQLAASVNGRVRRFYLLSEPRELTEEERNQMQDQQFDRQWARFWQKSPEERAVEVQRWVDRINAWAQAAQRAARDGRGGQAAQRLQRRGQRILSRIAQYSAGLTPEQRAEIKPILQALGAALAQ